MIIGWCVRKRTFHAGSVNVDRKVSLRTHMFIVAVVRCPIEIPCMPNRQWRAVLSCSLAIWWRAVLPSCNQYTSAHISAHQCISIHIGTQQQYTSVHIGYISVHTNTHQYISVHICVFQYTSIHISTHLCTYIYIYICAFPHFCFSVHLDTRAW